MDFQHKPVLLTETLRFWTAAASGVYMDGTLGGGGHIHAAGCRFALPVAEARDELVRLLTEKLG